MAGALSLAVAIALERWQINEDGFEGLLLLLAAVFVISMIIWMNRVARHLRKDIEGKIENYAFEKISKEKLKITRRVPVPPSAGEFFFSFF